MDKKDPNYNVITRVGKLVRQGKYYIFDYETAGEPGVLKVQRLTESEARQMFRQLCEEFESK